MYWSEQVAHGHYVKMEWLELKLVASSWHVDFLNQSI